MTKSRWVMLLVLVATLAFALGVTNAFGVKRIGNLYPVQGVFVAACEASVDCTFTTSSTQWSYIPGASYTFTLPDDEVLTPQALIWARFSGQTRCAGGPGDCLVRSVISIPGGGTIIMYPTPAPNDPAGLYFEGTSSDGFEAHATEQVYCRTVGSGICTNTGPGQYTVREQARVAPKPGATNPTFRFAGWTLAVEVAYDPGY